MKIVTSMKNISCIVKERSLFISSFFMPENLFYKSFFTILYKVNNKINFIIFVDTNAIRFNFINEKFTEIICKKLLIQWQYLTKLTQI